jgi:hypothetical protein
VLVLRRAGRGTSLLRQAGRGTSLTACQGLVLIIPHAGRSFSLTADRALY